MSNNFRDRARFRNQSGDEILQSLREQIDKDRKMFFDSPDWRGESSKSPFNRPGFPFDEPEDRAPRSSRFQKHLDDIANRHPEFADHFRFGTWGPRNRRSSGGSGGTGVFSSEEDSPDNRSQASGGSEMSTEGHSGDQPNPVEDKSKIFNKLPQYGLRNTVDLGGAAQQLKESERNQRSWSAPPDSRTIDPNQPKRYISRIEIQPKIPGAQSQAETSEPQPTSPSVGSPGKPPVAPKQSSAKSAGNVRQIPIFVEGRDEPVLARDTTDNSNPVPPSKEDHFTGHNDQFSHEFPGNSHFAERPFSESPFADRFSRPHFTGGFHQKQYNPQHGFRSPTQGHGFPTKQQPQQQQKPTPQQAPVTPQKRPTASQTPPTKRQSDIPPASQSSSPPPSSAPPANDPLSKVAVVQKDVEALYEQVSQFSGNDRKDKQYIYLDEMLTRNLLRLDDIDTEGKDNIRQARKEAIRSIQRAISLLESKVPVSEPSKTENESMEVKEVGTEETEPNSAMEVVSDTMEAQKAESLESPLPSQNDNQNNVPSENVGSEEQEKSPENIQQ